jgi:hypothetical protein
MNRQALEAATSAAAHFRSLAFKERNGRLWTILPSCKMTGFLMLALARAGALAAYPATSTDNSDTHESMYCAAVIRLDSNQATNARQDSARLATPLRTSLSFSTSFGVLASWRCIAR